MVWLELFARALAIKPNPCLIFSAHKLSIPLEPWPAYANRSCYTEFKEIRKEWKAKKKEEENARKQDEERARQEAARNGQDGGPPQGPPQYGQPGMMPPHMAGGPQLPPIGYQPASQAPGQYQPQQVDGAPQYGGQPMYGGQGYPQSPYTQGGLPYSQRM